MQKLEISCINELENFPPYPEGFKMPEEIKAFWINRLINNKRHFILRDSTRPSYFNRGDTFNSIVLAKKRKRFHTYSQRNHRVYQFNFPPFNYLGKVVFEEPESKKKILSKGEIVNGLVYKFEIVDIDKRDRVLYLAPLKNPFEKDNLLFELINCNYKSHYNRS